MRKKRPAIFVGLFLLKEKKGRIDPNKIYPNRIKKTSDA
jgi:hypothetical protein|tara:strand:+ start:1722 stop:1838 length:117 start_codon:yes stop_codon:yes gene_type:complete